MAQPARLPDDPGSAWRESGAAFLFPRIAEECRSGRGELADQLPDLSLSAQGSAGAEHPGHEAADPALSGSGVRHLYEP